MEILEKDLKQAFHLVGYQFTLKAGKVRFTLECWQTLNAKSEISLQTQMPGPAVNVPDRVTDSHREASPPRSPP